MQRLEDSVFGGVSSGGETGAFELSDGGEETENTVLDSTDCDSKVGRNRRYR